ncbi:MAG: hypothetical protein J4F29_20705 [Candidatus Latescibacteria bacterium]|nr:hypothetical protein [Candidatus Latescibacterota bacterium]
MSAPSLLTELEESIRRLSLDEQLLLIERVSHRIRNDISGKTNIDAQLSKMAADPEIQKELREIEHEFSATEQDGLDD